MMTIVTDVRDSDFRGIVDDAMARWTVPGVTVGILQDGEREMHGFGVTNLDTMYSVRPDTLFQIGSISKTFCGTLVMMLVEDGVLDLDATVADLVPEWRIADDDARQQITLRQCLTHSAGFYGDFFSNAFGHGDDALATSVAAMGQLEQWFAPGTRWAYNNAAVNLAGRVIEAVTGRVYEDLVRERIFLPLVMMHSTFYAHEAILHSASAGHVQIAPGMDLHRVAHPYPVGRYASPAGSIISTVGDLLTYAAFHMGDGTAPDGRRLLSQESMRTMQTVQAPSQIDAIGGWGISWSLKNLDGVRTVGHGGATNGFQANFVMVPERNFACTVLTNSGRGAALHRYVTNWLLNDRLGLDTSEPATIDLEPAALERVAGRFSNPRQEVVVSAQDGALRVEASWIGLGGERSALPAYTLRPINATQYLVVDGEGAGGLVEFFADSDTDGDGVPTLARMGGRLVRRVG